MTAISVTPSPATGAAIAVAAASASATVPNDNSGNKAKWLRIAATTACYVRIGVGAQTAVNTDMLVQPGDAVVLRTVGDTVAAIRVSADGVLTITPLESVQ